MHDAKQTRSGRAIDSLVRQSLEDQTKLTETLLRMPTIEAGQFPGAIDVVSRALDEKGFDVERHNQITGQGTVFPYVIGWLGQRTRQPDLLLCTHIDTSPAGEGWAFDPFGAERKDGFLYGRGAAVSKSDTACFIYAASAAWTALMGKSDGTIAVAVTSDEGAGGDMGVGQLLNRHGIRPRVAIFPGSTDDITVAHNGCVQIRVRITTAACHQSSVTPAEDAMRATTQLCSEIYALADRLSDRPASEPLRPTLNITKVVGGTVFGMAPSEVEIWIDRRVTPTESLEEAQDELIATIARLSETSSTRATYEIVRKAQPMRPDPAQQPFADLLREEARSAFGKELTELHSTLYTDARWYSNAAIPTLMYGVGESDIRASRANGADERIPEIFLQQATAILARAISRFMTEHD